MNETANPEQPSNRVRTLGHVLLFWIGYALLLVGSGPLSAGFPRSWRQVVFATIVSLGVFAMTVLLVRREKMALKDVGAALSRRSPPRFVIGFLIGLALVALNYAAISLATNVSWVWAPKADFAGALIILAGYVAKSCVEELGFRGYPLRRLEAAFGLWPAQAIVAVAFAIAHIAAGWPLLQALLGTTTGSLLFGMAAIASRGLALPIGLHAAWNFGEWMLGGKGSPGLWRVVVEDAPSSGMAIYVSYFAVMGLGTLGFWLWHRRNLQRRLFM